MAVPDTSAPATDTANFDLPCLPPDPRLDRAWFPQTRTFHFEAILDEVEVLEGAGPSLATSPPQPGDILKGDFTLYMAENYLWDSINWPTGTPVPINGSDEEQTLPAVQFSMLEMNVSLGGQDITFENFPLDPHTYVKGILGGQPFDIKDVNYAWAEVWDNDPVLGDVFEVSMASPERLNYVSGTGARYVDAALQIMDARCGAGGTSHIQQTLGQLKNANNLYLPMVLNMDVVDSDPVPDDPNQLGTAYGIVGAVFRQVDFGSGYFPAAQRLDRNEFSFSFLDQGTAPTTSGRTPGHYADCADAVAGIAQEFADATDAGEIYNPFRAFNTSGRVTYLGTAPSSTTPPIAPLTAVPLPAGLPLGLAGLGALVWLQRRDKRAA